MITVAVDNDTSGITDRDSAGDTFRNYSQRFQHLGPLKIIKTRF